MNQDRDSQESQRDLFAHIATTLGKEYTEILVEPTPPDLPDLVLPLDEINPDAFFQPATKIDSPLKLKRELSKQRRLHAKFLRNFAPAIDSTRITLKLEEFDWREQTEEDSVNFAGTLAGHGEWKRVRIPHYGPPLGRKVTYYRTTFDLTEDMLAKGSLFVCFKGVDYKAHVFINNAYLGSHEGFFAPFEFEFTRVAKIGTNVLLVKVENDAIFMGNESWGEDGEKYEGDKLYAATGPGYDEPVVGWHHCPPGMGIYQGVSIEARPKIFISDVFVRPVPEESRAEAWVEIYSCHELRQNVSLKLSVFGQNFKKTVFRDRDYQLATAGPGINYYRLPFKIPNPRLWNTKTPWLYQAQVTLFDNNGQPVDIFARQFGMRSFFMDEQGDPKGRFYLNCQEIRLRGANTMGFEQRDVMNADWDQLIDDILLAKICNLNFLRLTQRPVQEEVYDFCDRLGLMTQTDLPLFGVIRRNQFAEAVRQAGEMEKLVRSHPCNVLVSFINEPFPDAGGKPHRHLTKTEMLGFFEAASQAVRIANPDRVIKPVDGDYDPPSPGLPDNHCYTGWYNGHGLDIGKLHKGYWQKVKPGWMYGCGEFGAEGLDPVATMRKYYPAEWLPAPGEDERKWSPNRIPQAQTGRLHYLWFDTQDTLEDWVRASQAHQARIVKLMTEAFRRDNRMSSFAVHLFIDAWPSGWMKSIMDVDRNPKPAYFAYLDALNPLIANLRTDRTSFTAGEQICIEAWICNDTNEHPNDFVLCYSVERDGETFLAQCVPANIVSCGSSFQGFLKFEAPEVERREHLVVRLGLVDSSGRTVHDTHVLVEVFPKVEPTQRNIHILSRYDGPAIRLAKSLGLYTSNLTDANPKTVVLIDDVSAYLENQDLVNKAVAKGAMAVFFELPKGKYEIFGREIEVVPCTMGSRHFVSRKTGHPLVSDFKPDDFAFWYDSSLDRISPILDSVILGKGLEPILTAGNGDWNSSEWTPCAAVAEFVYGKGRVRLCQLRLSNFADCNPVAKIFSLRLLQDRSVWQE